MLSKFRPRRPSHTTVVAYLSLFLVLTGGTAVALSGSNTVFSDDITNGEVKTSDIAEQAVGTGKVKDSSLTGQDIKPDSIGGPRIVESSLGKVPNADKLDNLDSSAFTRRTCGIASGAIQGFARINASDSFSSTFTTQGVESPYNCSGQTVEAVRRGVGDYEVRFNGNGAGWALAGALNVDGNVSPVLMGTVTYVNGVHRVRIYRYTNGGGCCDDQPFVILLF